MPRWWGKSSSKEKKKKENMESIIDAIHGKLKIAPEENYSTLSEGFQGFSSDTISEKGSYSGVNVQSPSASIQVSHCQSFAERSAQPLPLPGDHLTAIHHVDSQSGASSRSGSYRDYKRSFSQPIHKPGLVAHEAHANDADLDLGTASVSSDSPSGRDDPSDSCLLSPQASNYEDMGKTAMNSSSLKQKDQSLILSKRSSRETLRPNNLIMNKQTALASPKQRPLGSHVSNLQIPPPGAYYCGPDSSKSSPSRSPITVFGHEPAMNYGYWPGKQQADVYGEGSGHCSSPYSGHNSGQNSVGGDMSGRMFWQHGRCDPECFLTPTPNKTSPRPSSRIQSGAVTPLNPRAAVATLESPMALPDDRKPQSYRLPLPPVTVSSQPPVYPSYSTGTYPMTPRSPGQTENPTSPGLRLKKGRLLGRGTFGQVYLGFNSELGEMCAMKEVALLSDDPKSRESAQQLGQEIALLSRLHHPNIVQYYGSEMVDDKLYIYLEYVSGGSIYKLLQDYGALGESAIRSYTQQILSGLAYLHSQNTVHRDIKGANILVDPNGRVKLADFGMAKHITGQSCPLSFKGSPYWMAPEVINNSNGRNLAVDIWSLGCTVLEMATTRPPWSQYEGVAAMFKIGNSKELPPIPDNLSDECKDFVRKCLQRNPTRRPSAVRLLEHPFIKNATPFERPGLGPSPIAAIPGVKSSIRATRNLHFKIYPCLDPHGAFHQTRGSRNVSGLSDAPLRNISCPLSPTRRSNLQPRSPRHMSGRLSPSPLSSPHGASCSSTPSTGGNGSVPFHHPNHQMNYMNEGLGTMTKSQNSYCSSANICYQDLKPDIFQGVSQAHFFQEVVPPESSILRDQFVQPTFSNPQEEVHYEQSALAERVSQQLLRNHVTLNPLVDLNPRSSLFNSNNGF